MTLETDKLLITSHCKQISSVYKFSPDLYGQKNKDGITFQ